MIDPLKLTQNVRDSYIRYLTSTFRLRDSNLQRLFHEEVKRFWFTNGPILEATQPFKKGDYLQNLIDNGFLNKSLEKFIYDALPYLYDNQLYLHQDRAIRRILEGRNVVLASGTSSGKTECFLLPIYNYLIEEYQKGKLTPGVRAILLYPMNALANDQLRRLREVAAVMEEKLPKVNLTFGRYVGDTPETREEGEEKFSLTNPDKEPVKSELLSREEMRENPPHILITNYAMLEYLLLRPQDSPFFDGEYAKYWKFLVLDEAHIYSGATGIEIAMLIRRLKDRVCNNMEGDLQCIATSATLVKEEDDFGRVAEFATNLFGEEFKWDIYNEDRQDIIKGERLTTEAESSTLNLPIQLYSELNNIVRSNPQDALREAYNVCEKFGIDRSLLDTAKNLCEGDVKRFFYEVLSKDEKVIKLKKLMEKGAKSLEDCVAELIEKENPSDEDRQCIIDLINLAVKSRPHKESLPLIPARYHLFVRAPEGIFVSLYPEPRIFLDRREKTEDGYPVFELASCRRCGQGYLVGNIKDGKLKHSFDQMIAPRFFLLWSEGSQLEEDDDQEVAVPEKIAEKGKSWNNLCTECGSIWDTEPICSCEREAYNTKIIIEITPKDDVLNICYSCGLRAPNVVREFIFQQDAPAAVLATALYENLGRENKKKILTFSDNRQDAAFFAPYLDFTHKRILFRRLIIEALRENLHPQDYRLNSLVEDVLKIAEERKIFDPSMDRKEKIKEIWKWVLQEYCGLWDKRNSLEGVGLLFFEPITPENWEPIKELQEPPWNLTIDESIAVYKTLLDTLRYNTAITFPEEGPSPQDEFFYPRNREYVFRGEGSDIKKGIYSFIPASGRLNARLEYLKKLHNRVLGIDSIEECIKLLGRIWSDIRDNWVNEGLNQFSNSKQGIIYQLDYRYWQVAQRNSETRWYTCDRCGAIVPRSVKGVCPTFNCHGNLKALDPEGGEPVVENHYRYLYSNLSPSKMVTHEHTAQLAADYASNVQQRFIRGDINVLSCSTTFELGVDLGELETIFMRNVPPEPSNYIQRAGRAGRRLETVGFTLTFAQLRSHDLTYFKEPEKMVEGRINPPVVELRNEKIIRRHLHSIVFSSFFKQFPDYFGKAESFFRLESNGEPGPIKMKEFLNDLPETVLSSLKRAIPSEMQATLDIENWNWIEDLIGVNGVLTVADEKIRDEFDNLIEYYNSREEEWKNNRNQQKRNRLNRDMNWANRRIETIKRRGLIDFLATHAVIPKYGFPVDVVELATLSQVPESKNIKLERDLRIAISEFAPSSQIVANGYVWESAGLRVLRNRTWPIFWYATCPECKRFYIQDGRIGEAPPPISCEIHGDIPRNQIKSFVTPYFGFVTNRESKPKKPGESRPKREFGTRPYFFDYKEPVIKDFSIGKLKVKCRYSSDGELAVVCKGKKGAGFWICFTCGSAFSNRPKKNDKHKTPFGVECSSTLRGPFHLGHTFKTDVLSISFEEPQLDSFNESFWYSMLYALLEGTSQALGIGRRDLDGCLYPSEEGVMLVLFDNVPGGAGHVKRIIDEGNLHSVLKSALERVENCTCGFETSCYGCLRNYQNQFCHDQLERGVILEFLKTNFERQ